MQNAITIKQLTKKYRLYKQANDRLKESLSLTGKKYHTDFAANNNLSFEIKKGEVVGIIGTNGSGKSTLLKMITGVLTPTSGSIEVTGKITALLELGAGFNPEMSGLENLYLSGSVSGLSQEEMKQKIDEIVDFAEIGEFIYQPLKTYSSGMKARLGFAFAINVDPEILIIDEALSVGDAAFQRKCYAKIEHMCSSDAVTVLFVSHSGGAIKQLCNRAILLHQGELIIDGVPKKVVNLYEKFMGSKDVERSKIQAEYQKMLDDENKPVNQQLTKSYFNPNMISKSLTEFKQNGARIFDLKILNSNTVEVNVLEKSEIYECVYYIQYSEVFQNVRVNMKISDLKGVMITGQAHFLEFVEKDCFYKVVFSFENRLNSGEYFISVGTNSRDYGEFILLHKINDAYMFKVHQEIQDDGSRGICDFMIESEVDSHVSLT